jgi:hypothetical protein
MIARLDVINNQGEGSELLRLTSPPGFVETITKKKITEITASLIGDRGQKICSNYSIRGDS